METKRKWYQLTRIWVIAGFLFISALIASSSSNPANNAVEYKVPAVSNSASVVNSFANTEVKTPTTEIKIAPKTETQPTKLSNNNTYVNTAGNTVHSPAYSETGNIPAGASARCGDGTYSFSQSRRGTCSRHGGVNTWY
jgi:hypothetical protein